MTFDISLVYLAILAVLVVPIFTSWRYDLVALIGMLAVIIVGIVTPEVAFNSFGHPAVVTVAAVLVAGQGLQNAGAVDVVAGWLSGVGQSITLQLAALCGLVAVASAFMNNVGALALFMPVGIRMAQRSERPASLYLLPLAFSAHFGGMMTLIGTPPNIIVATFRADYAPGAFGMFEFLPLGLGIAVASVAFMALVGWKLIPVRRGGSASKEMFTIEDYFSEVRVTEDSDLIDKPVRQLHASTEADILIVGIVRGDERLPAPSGFEVIRRGDVLLVRADADDLSRFVKDCDCELAEEKPIPKEALQSDEITTIEAVVRPDSMLARRTARNLNLRWRYAVNLLAVSRQGAQLQEPLGSIRLQPGDVLLLQGHAETLPDTLEQLGCLPLARREIGLGRRRQVVVGTTIFGSALIVSALGLLAVQVAMTAAACAMVVAGTLRLREAYESIDWPIVILLGAMIALGEAMQATGGDALIATQILRAAAYVPAAGMVVLVLLVTMALSDLVQNVGAVVLMAPIVINVAQGLGVSIDPFLVAVAIGGSCAFLTPIGHQSNVLVLEPGGYEFGDYWRLGLPLEIIIVAVAVPLLLTLWPL